jgi:hypothetical protein
MCPINPFSSPIFNYIVLLKEKNFALKLSICFIRATQLSLLWKSTVAEGFCAVFTLYNIEQGTKSHKLTTRNSKHASSQMTSFLHHTDPGNLCQNKRSLLHDFLQTKR